MSKLEQLIAEYCPDGVPFVKLGEIAVRTKGTPITAAQMKALDKPNAPVKIFAGGKTVAYFDYADLPEKDINTNDTTGKSYYSLAHGNFKEFMRRPIIKSRIVSNISQIADSSSYSSYLNLSTDESSTIVTNTSKEQRS